eukprot:TRINITY_DN28533_c0_g1_i1.p1 TRINITY_DN28533_c0_g1~~TRINITY_DN28533_c0_g1_i1.p1  ORF type:complete len:366 (+),score=74.08 TRINITY_DN28533_c0_g1_i1:57-1154(+)
MAIHRITLSVASLFALAAASYQSVVDTLFEQYLPEDATWVEVKKCREACNGDKQCIDECPHYECPWKRVSQQCDIFNSTLAESKACHHACEHDFACHFKCPMTQPASVKQLQLFGKAMLCHHTCGHDKTCHEACPSAWEEKQELCGKLEEVVSCHHLKHHDCPRLDNKTKQALLEEPSSLTKDVLLHVADHLLPLPSGQKASREEVKACHQACRTTSGDIRECHKNCPKGAWGRLKDQCKMMSASASCHESCKNLESKCPFSKMKCHFQCPTAMPSSVHELKNLADHVACHADCGQDQSCHESCPDVWAQKHAQCQAYNNMTSCWSSCGHSHACYAKCGSARDLLAEVEKAPYNVIKDALRILMV